MTCRRDDSHELVATNGPAPDHEYRRNAAAPRPLPPPTRSAFDDLLRARRTCRNFDPAAEVSADDLATMLHRVWGAVGTLELAPGAVAVKKTSPAGGGLHSIEAYVLVQRAEGVAPGVHHYLAMEHALEPIRLMSPEQTARTLRRFVAGQEWFFDAPVAVVMTARFDRLFWKYRRHAKAWRVSHLDVGHLSQTMYLSAADRGLGAFVTAAINDREIEDVLGLEPFREAAIALVGFGPRSGRRDHVELDDVTLTAAARLAGHGDRDPVAEADAFGFLHRALDRQKIAPVAREKRGREFRPADRRHRRHNAPTIACRHRGIADRADMLVGNDRKKEGRRPAPFDDFSPEAESLHQFLGAWRR